MSLALRATAPIAAAAGLSGPVARVVAQTATTDRSTLPVPLAPIPLALIEGFSGSFANAGEAVARNLAWAIERVNQRGGVRLPQGARPLQLVRFDSKGNTDDALSMLRAAIDRDIGFVMQGNSSATASALISALDKNNARNPEQRAVFLNYSAIDPALTREQCSFWHFRFDADADARLDALTDVLRDDRSLRKVFLVGQAYSFGQYVVRRAREMLHAKRPDIEIVGELLHPLGRIKDFAPYAARIAASGAQAVVTGNWGNDLTLLVRAAGDQGSTLAFYTFYGNALGAPAAIGQAGVGSVFAVAEWHPNVGGAGSDAFYRQFRQRYPDPRDDYVHVRMQVMIEMLVAAMQKAGKVEPVAVARALEGLRDDGAVVGGEHTSVMRASDHQLLQPLFVSVMERAGTNGVRFDSEGSGYGFKTVRRVDPSETALSAPTGCHMARPG